MDFNNYWTLIGGDINFADRKEATEKAWHLASPEKQQAKAVRRKRYDFLIKFPSAKEHIVQF